MSKKKFKFKELKSFKSTDRLTFKNKYRSLFIAQNIDWISAELSFYNILFDEEPWNCKVRLQCFRILKSSEEKFFDEEQEITVGTDQNIVYHRDGWGNKNKTFWTKGVYKWVAFIDDTMVGESKFYVEDAGLVSKSNNPFFSIDSIRLYESGSGDVSFGQRTYYTQFKDGDTRFVNTEITCTNKLNLPWNCEFQFFYYNWNGQLVGKDSRIFSVSDESFRCAVGYGSEGKTTWKEGSYTCEIIFADNRIAIIPFTVGDEWIQGDPIYGDEPALEGSAIQTKPNQEEDEVSLNELLENLDQMIGLQEIKSQIRNYIGFLQFEKVREEKGLADTRKINLHAVLTGNPGTGKTTVAKQLGKIYKALGLLSKGHVHEVDRADLIGEYIGHTAPKVRQAIETARGGVLFIDEAYALYREDTKNDFGHEAIEILLKEMSDGPGDLVVLTAGYPEEMNKFILSNPGLKSRFAHYFRFPDYVPEELMEIADLGLKKRSLTMTDEAKDFMFTQLTKAYRGRDRSFGNARYVMSLVDEAKLNLALRLVKENELNELADDVLSTIQLEDVQKIFSGSSHKALNFKIDEVELHAALSELDGLIGIENIKNEIRDLVKLVKYYHEIGKDVLNQFVLHTVFVGNPGTGKTTVARIFARVFKALGIIERGHLIECDREALVASYTGQTAPKTAGVVDSAIGGVLFIDEAYSLKLGDHDEFGAEAVNTLLKRMEDRNKEFIVIAAGYPDNMKEFLQSNPGLNSRFERTIMFNDYSAEELMQITLMMFEWEGLILTDEVRELLLAHFEGVVNSEKKFFGNGRYVRNLVQSIVRDHSLRMAMMDASERNGSTITTITEEDLRSLSRLSTESSKRRTIGF